MRLVDLLLPFHRNSGDALFKVLSGDLDVHLAYRGEGILAIDRGLLH